MTSGKAELLNNALCLDSKTTIMTTASMPREDSNDVYSQLEIYPWDTDKEFQGGLSAILGPKPSSDPFQIHDLTLRAQCFYFSRKKSIPVDFNGYKAYLASRPSVALTPSNPSSATPQLAADKMAIQVPPQTNQGTTLPASQAVGGPPPHPAKFQEIVALIQAGKPIPGIMDIPDTVLTGQGSKPSLPKRKKPWEKELPSTTEGTFGDQRDYYIEQELPEETPAASTA